MDTRPTTDRIKETLFNILQPQLLDCRFLDLFSGSGGIGIEALSRGASYAVFVEKNPKACSCIRENLSFTKLAENGKLLNMDVLQALRSLEGKGAFDIIFIIKSLSIRYLNICVIVLLWMRIHLLLWKQICTQILLIWNLLDTGSFVPKNIKQTSMYFWSVCKYAPEDVWFSYILCGGK